MPGCLFLPRVIRFGEISKVFGKILKVLGNILRVNLVFVQIWNPLWQILFAIEQIFVDVNDQILKKV